MSFEHDEVPSFLNAISLKDVLSQEIFTHFPESTNSLDEAKGKILATYQNFNFNLLSDEMIFKMLAVLNRLESESRRIVDLYNNGKKVEAYTLSRNIKLLGDPKISRSESGIEGFMVSLDGNMLGTKFFLGIQNIKDSDIWIEFIIRTWGKSPKDYIK